MRIYVLAGTAHLEHHHKIDVTKERKSLDGSMCIFEMELEIPSGGEQAQDSFIGCSECRTFTHPSMMEYLNAPEAAGVWYKSNERRAVDAEQGAESGEQKNDFENSLTKTLTSDEVTNDSTTDIHAPGD